MRRFIYIVIVLTLIGCSDDTPEASEPKKLPAGWTETDVKDLIARSLIYSPWDELVRTANNAVNGSLSHYPNTLYPIDWEYKGPFRNRGMDHETFFVTYCANVEMLDGRSGALTFTAYVEKRLINNTVFSDKFRAKKSHQFKENTSCDRSKSLL